jgi:hypothetical protein
MKLHETKSRPSRSWTSSLGVAWPISILAVTYLVMAAIHLGAGEAVVCPDTSVYEWPASHLSPLSLDFYTASRPFTTLWLFWLVGGSHALVVKLQSVIAAGGWLLLAIAMQRLFHRQWVGLLAAFLTLLLSLAWPIQSWNHLLLSESLCFSLLSAAIGLSILVFHPKRSSVVHPRAAWALVLVWGCVFLLWGGTRDTVAYSIAVVAVLLLGRAALLLRRRRRARPGGLPARGPGATLWLFAALFLLLLSFGLNELTEASGRWKTTVLNSILWRILPDEAASDEWTHALGMPDSPRLRQFTAKYYWDHVGDEPQEIRDIVIRNPSAHGGDLAGFPGWLSRDGLRAMRTYLLRHPWDTLKSAVVAYAELPAYRSDSHLNSVRRPAVSRAAAWLFFPAHGWRWPVIGLSFLILMAACCVDKKWGPVTWSAVLLLHAFVQLEVGYHGDAHSVDRHTLLAGILFRLALIVLYCGALDGVRRAESHAYGQPRPEGAQPPAGAKASSAAQVVPAQPWSSKSDGLVPQLVSSNRAFPSTAR